MSDLEEIWDSHKVTIIAASILILAVLMVGAVFLTPGLYVVVTLVGFLLAFFGGGRMSGSRKVQYIGILVAVIGLVGLTVRDVGLVALGVLVAGVVGGLAVVVFLDS